jgi:hypothetical protein
MGRIPEHPERNENYTGSAGKIQETMEKGLGRGVQGWPAKYGSVYKDGPATG